MSAHVEPLLEGHTVFLSASVPDKAREKEFRRIEYASDVIEQAVIGLARAVLAHGGKLVFGAHPSISPLIASVASEYVLPGEPPRVIIYQSRAFKDVLPDETWSMHRLGYAQLAWTDAAAGEHFVRGTSKTDDVKRSLTAMRRAMIEVERPRTMVVVGGMAGIFEEARTFCNYWGEHVSPAGAAMYVAARTGGAAEQLVARRAEYGWFFHVLEDDWSTDTKQEIERKPETNDPRDRTVIPYAAMAQWLVRVIGG